MAVAHRAERIGLVDCLNQHLPWDPAPCRLSPGVRLVALMIAVWVKPQAWYRLPEFYAEQDCAVLFGDGVQAEPFTDDALGKLFEGQPAQIFNDLSRQAIARLK